MICCLVGRGRIKIETCEMMNFPSGSVINHPPAMKETQRMRVESLEEEMAAHSIILARKIPWTEEPGGLESMGS